MIQNLAILLFASDEFRSLIPKFQYQTLQHQSVEVSLPV